MKITSITSLIVMLQWCTASYAPYIPNYTPNTLSYNVQVQLEPRTPSKLEGVKLKAQRVFEHQRLSSVENEVSDSALHFTVCTALTQATSHTLWAQRYLSALNRDVNNVIVS